MTDRQLQGLEELEKCLGPLPSSTGAALVRQGFAKRHDLGFEITEEGRAFLGARTTLDAEKRIFAAVDEEQGKVRERALGWLAFSGTLTSYGTIYARLVLSALLVGEEPPSSKWEWTPEQEASIADLARQALEFVSDFDKARRSATSAGEVFVGFEPSRPAPGVETHRIRRAAEEASAAGITDLGKYREGRA